MPDDNAAETVRAASETVTCILNRCAKPKCVFAHVVPCNGADEDQFVSKLIADNTIWLGYGEIQIKTDNEASLTALVKQVIDQVMKRRDNVNITEESPARTNPRAMG